MATLLIPTGSSLVTGMCSYTIIGCWSRLLGRSVYRLWFDPRSVCGRDVVTSTLIAAAGAVFGYINASGGVVVILMTIGFVGFFAYMTAWGVYFVMNLLTSAMERANREITDQGALWAAGLIWVGFTVLLVHFAVGGVPPADYSAEYDSLGQFLFAATGTAVLVVPLGIFWF